MKKTTLSTIYATLKDMNYDPEILTELETELNKGAEAKAKNAQAYAELLPIVVQGLSEATRPVTCAELWEAIKKLVPDGATKGNVQYGLTKLWGEVVKVNPGKPNTYELA